MVFSMPGSRNELSSSETVFPARYNLALAGLQDPRISIRAVAHRSESITTKKVHRSPDALTRVLRSRQRLHRGLQAMAFRAIRDLWPPRSAAGVASWIIGLNS